MAIFLIKLLDLLRTQRKGNPEDVINSLVFIDRILVDRFLHIGKIDWQAEKVSVKKITETIFYLKS